MVSLGCTALASTSSAAPRCNGHLWRSISNCRTRQCSFHAVASQQHVSLSAAATAIQDAGQQQAATALHQSPDVVSRRHLPKHVAIIMDGNSRWAQSRGLPAWVGHERGAAAFKTAVMAAVEYGIEALTVFAFSLENWQRDASEIAFLMDLLQNALRQQLPELQQSGVQLHFMGELHLLPQVLQEQMVACEAATAGNMQLVLNIAVSYSGQADITAALQALARQVVAGQLTPQQITSELLAQSLSSASVTAAVGPPDLLIRTSGEQRLSNFMLWELAYTELCFLDVMWPDFGKQQFQLALHQYSQRQRRYGQRKA